MAARYCTRCGNPVPVNATACPVCNTPFVAAGTAPVATPNPVAQGPRRTCANCHAQMRWIGHYSLRAGGYTGAAGVVAGDLNQLAETLLPFSLYYCQACGKFDFYYPGT